MKFLRIHYNKSIIWQLDWDELSLGTNTKKTVTMQKTTERGDPLVSPCIVCYAEKEEKLFWFSSLGQMIQFGTINFCRTFVELFWSGRVD